MMRTIKLLIFLLVTSSHLVLAQNTHSLDLEFGQANTIGDIPGDYFGGYALGLGYNFAPIENLYLSISYFHSESTGIGEEEINSPWIHTLESNFLAYKNKVSGTAVKAGFKTAFLERFEYKVGMGYGISKADLFLDLEQSDGVYETQIYHLGDFKVKETMFFHSLLVEAKLSLMINSHLNLGLSHRFLFLMSDMLDGISIRNERDQSEFNDFLNSQAIYLQYHF